jgi:hypothetical protein
MVRRAEADDGFVRFPLGSRQLWETLHVFDSIAIVGATGAVGGLIR